jgi:cob(I)alamin adenosyltransferase
MAIHLTKIYTRSGDNGTTALIGGQRVSKDSLRVESFGTSDELNCELGMMRTLAMSDTNAEIKEKTNLWLMQIQNEVFDLGSLLACLPSDTWPGKKQFSPDLVTRLEEEMDWMQLVLKPLNSFTLPGGSLLNASAHKGRTICRRLERLMVHLDREESVEPVLLAYVNRLSDWLFVYSRWVANVGGVPEYLWQTPLQNS